MTSVLNEVRRATHVISQLFFLRGRIDDAQARAVDLPVNCVNCFLDALAQWVEILRSDKCAMIVVGAKRGARRS